ncbi:TlpA family protein disulfide reductase [bacterium]|nr:MAG: TlpA family protein disulfide reductase [bacterium]
MKKRVQAKKRSRVYVWVVPGIVLLATTYFLFGKNETQPTSTATGYALPPTEVSGVAPAFTLSDVNGHQVSLSDFKGKVVILDFWATWCPPCKREIPDFIKLQSEYGSKGVQIVGIALDQPEKVKAFERDNAMNYPVLMGNDEVSAHYGGVESIPTTFIIDKAGRIVTKYEGFRSKETFESQIKKLL